MAAPVDHGPFPPAGLNLNRPSNARVHDYFLGGTANWAMDRTLGDQIIDCLPLVRSMCTANRLFLHRAVRHLVELGVRQFVDLGCGLPTTGQAHEIAEAAGAVRAVYVDHDPIAVAHNRVHLEQHGDPRRHAVLHADLRAPGELWALIGGTGVLDLAEPVALLAVAVLDLRQPGRNGATDICPDVVAGYRELLADGSYLALSHTTVDGVPPGLAARLAEAADRYAAAGTPLVPRTRPEIADLFGGFALLPPGLTWAQLWHAEYGSRHLAQPGFAAPNEVAVLAGVGRKG